MRFYLGTHEPHWLGMAGVPLFVSHRRLKVRKKLPQARAPWACDSGGFTELSTYGTWRTTADEYLEAVHRYSDEIGRLDFAAPRDWMCEPWITDMTGLSVREHQHRTVTDYLDLTSRSDLPFIPVLQGWSEDDYLACVDMYADAGVDLTAERVVGIGSVCRRESSDEIARILARLAAAGIKLHGFGVKKGGLMSAAPFLASADSMAWSFSARAVANAADGWRCPYGGTHQSCSNCQPYALHWRDTIIYTIGGDGWSLSPSTSQVSWQPTLL